MYQYYQPNKRKYACDCVVRALMKVLGTTWKDTYKELCDIGLEMMDMPNSMPVCRECLERHGFKNTTIKVPKGSRRPTVASFALEHTHGAYVVSVAGHVVAVVDGVYYDSWDSGEKCLYRYFSK